MHIVRDHADRSRRGEQLDNRHGHDSGLALALLPAQERLLHPGSRHLVEVPRAIDGHAVLAGDIPPGHAFGAHVEEDLAQLVIECLDQKDEELSSRSDPLGIGQSAPQGLFQKDRRQVHLASVIGSMTPRELTEPAAPDQRGRIGGRVIVVQERAMNGEEDLLDEIRLVVRGDTVISEPARRRGGDPRRAGEGGRRRRACSCLRQCRPDADRGKKVT